MSVKRLVLDVLKTNELSIIQLSRDLTAVKGVSGIDIVVKEVDRKVEKIRITVVGKDLHFDRLKEVIEGSGAVIHSVDQVSAGKITV